MNSLILGTMNSQDGLITREQALGHGLTDDQVWRLLNEGHWVRAHRGVYVAAEQLHAATTHAARRLIHDRAAFLKVSMPHVVSHDSAAHELGLELLHPQGQPYAHLTRPGVVGSHLLHGVKHHLAPLGTDDVVTLPSRRVTTPARTALDITREHGLTAGVVALDSARRMGASRGELEAAVQKMRHWPQVRACRAAIGLSDPESDSVGETLARLLVSELGFGRPQTQFGMTADGRSAWVDLRLGRHLIEFDGRAKYHRVDEGGFALRSADDVVWAEKQRQDWLMGFGLGMSRLTWDDVYGPRRAAALVRLRREYEQTCSAFGTAIEGLAQYRPREPRPRPQLRAA